MRDSLDISPITIERSVRDKTERLCGVNGVPTAMNMLYK